MGSKVTFKETLDYAQIVELISLLLLGLLVLPASAPTAR